MGIYGIKYMDPIWTNYSADGVVLLGSRKRMILFKFPKSILYRNGTYWPNNGVDFSYSVRINRKKRSEKVRAAIFIFL